MVLGSLLSKKTVYNENVGLFLPNVVASAVTFFALQAYNRVPAMINYTTGTNNIINSCKAAKIKKIVTSHTFVEKGEFQDVIKDLEEAGLEII